MKLASNTKNGRFHAFYVSWNTPPSFLTNGIIFLLYFSVNYLIRPSWILLVWACLFLETYMHVSSSLFQVVELIQRQVSLKITKNQNPTMSAVHIENGTGKLKTYVDQNQDSKDQIQKPCGLNIDFPTESRAFQQLISSLFISATKSKRACLG